MARRSVSAGHAWSRGADAWDAPTRRRFANDPANLFAVEAAANRRKGARGPTEWMPPDPAFHCQYLLRFTRVVLSYNLRLSQREAANIDAMRSAACG